MLRLKNMEIWKRLSLGFGSLGMALLVVAAIAELSASIDEVSRSAQDALGVMEAALDATQKGDADGGAT